MTARSVSWRRKAFSWVVVGCVQFVVLTLVAMLFYPGGTATDPTTRGYSFFTNFFSELGLTRTHTGGPNTISFILFFVALTLAGAGLVLFFVAFRWFFAQARAGRVLSAIGTLFGVISGICFIGVAWTPANLRLGLHGQFVMWAFEAFPVAVIPYAVAILLHKSYPKRFAVVFVAFAALLVLYLVLMIRGPGFATPQGVMIQATGQKVIVYASIVTILIQSLSARKRLT
jgi:hypothetical protein